MKLNMISAAAILALASTPAMAQLAGAGNLATTSGQQPNWPGVAHQSTTIVGAGGGTRGVIVSANGGNAAPGVSQSKIIPTPAEVSSRTPNRSAGAYVQTGAQKGGAANGALGRVAVTNNLGAQSSQTYREVGVHTPKQ